MPVNRVGQGMGDLASPIRVSRSGGMPDRSKPTALRDRNTTSMHMPSSRMPLKVSVTATARRPPNTA